MELISVTSEDALIREVAKTTKSVEFFIGGLDVIFRSLKDASWGQLEHLTLSGVNLHEQLTLLWPQDLVLPRLRTVTLLPGDGPDPDLPYSEGRLESLRSLLRAHSEQLECVRIKSYVELLAHLADALPSGLRRLEFEEFTVPSDAAALRRTHGLKELKIDIWLEDELYEQACIELEHFFRAPGQLERLELLRYHLPSINLGAGGLKSLQCLVLGGCYYDSLLEELAGLPRLRSLIIFCPHPRPLPEVFREITPAVIPALEVVVVSDNEEPCNRSPCVCPDFYSNGTACTRVPRLISELQGLVRRAPARLHAIYKYETMFFRHPVSETAGCPLCREASVEAVAALHDHYMGRTHIKLDGSVQCVKV
ncbi:uncharacterized protein LOC113217556 [Frankliniella occidentalis]|uniref:Uncharacterized protein LOC113217556 n=1 Tax=Frankliniella occidentalis TaxID=133901 RepID=A0A6J1TRH5_FRAOC|nr:uncharacterized protein LOC113217556 [Frankliniella occidentalis]